MADLTVVQLIFFCISLIQWLSNCVQWSPRAVPAMDNRVERKEWNPAGGTLGPLP